MIVATFFPIYLNVRYPLGYENIIRTESENNGLDPALVAAVISVESGYNVTAVSEKGAIGLMQLMPETASYVCATYGVVYDGDKLFDSEYNISLGCKYLRYLKDRFTENYALAAYNAGEGNVRKWIRGGGELRFRETREYVKRVYRAKKYYGIKYGSR